MNRQRKVVITVTYNDLGIIVDTKAEELDLSAQPEPTFEQIEEYCHKRCLSIVDNALLHKYAQAKIQPEIIRCKECKWKQGSECVRFADVRPFPDDFCSRAERRTDGRD